MLRVMSGPAGGLIAELVLLTALGTSVGLSAFGWFVGITCGIVVNALVARGLGRDGAAALGPADLVTLTRATLACGVAALTADSFLQEPALVALVAVAAAALCLDAVDGWVARRTGTVSVFGARFDGEVDAFLILVLSVYVASSVAWWVFAIGAARYVFALAGWPLPWLRGQLPFRYWRKVVTAAQGIVLTFAAADVAPRWITYAALAVAAALLAESFGRDVWWLWRRRAARSSGRSRRRRAVTVALNVLALLLVWFALVAPNQAYRLTPSAFLRIPGEALVLAALALVLPSRARRIMAGVVGVLIGLLTVLKILDMGFFEAFDRPFNLASDAGYLGSTVDLLRDTIGPVGATIAVAAAAVLVVALLVCMPLAVGRLTRLVAQHRGWSLRVVTVLVLAWIVLAATGLQAGQGEPIASMSAGRMAVDQARAIDAAAHDRARFDAAAAVDRFRDTSEDDLLAGLRGKDVLIVFVESYGRVAIGGLPSSTQVRAVLDEGTARLQASGYSTRSAFLTSPTFGGLSWLAHATLQSGLWVDNQRRYDRLLSGNRMTISGAFGRAGWRTFAVMPSNKGYWPEGKAFYGLDKIYGKRGFGYLGPRFGFSSMPDQYALGVFQQRVLGKRKPGPVMAEIDLSSSHAPWALVPQMVGWDRLGDGSVYEHQDLGQSDTALWGSPEAKERGYVSSIVYTLNAVISFVETYGDDDLVLILLGDHQPATVVSGHGASHDVPITLIARDPAVMEKISGWGWQQGMRPDSGAPVWPMNAFRDRFLSAYSSQPPPIPARECAPGGTTVHCVDTEGP